MKEIKVGDTVTIKRPVVAYYSRYAGNPKCIINPGEIGTVMVMDVAYVNRTGTFCCVDFDKPKLPMQGGGTVWRIGTNKANLTLKKGKHDGKT